MRGLTLDKPLFKIYKIRTIRESGSNAEDTGRRFLFSPGLREKVPQVCRKMRSFGLDELPQLFNIISGEMSLVGPRPLDTFDLEILKKNFPHYNKERSELISKPGIIGLWQINGSRSRGAENLLYWDKLYEKNKSLELDFDILFKGIVILYRKQKEDSILPLKPARSKTYKLQS